MACTFDRSNNAALHFGAETATLVTEAGDTASKILVEASASFLGVGVQPPTASWGRELLTGFRLLEQAPQIAFASGLMVTLAVLAFNFVGDSLRDLLDPRLRGGRH